jgi:hypothetical protein
VIHFTIKDVIETELNRMDGIVNVVEVFGFGRKKKTQIGTRNGIDG